MKKRSKIELVVALNLLLIPFLFSACGQKAANNEKTPQAKEDSKPATPSEERIPPLPPELEKELPKEVLEGAEREASTPPAEVVEENIPEELPEELLREIEAIEKAEKDQLKVDSDTPTPEAENEEE